MSMSANQARVIDPVLSSVVLGYKNAQMVGDHLFPRVFVTAAGGQILEFNKESFQLYNSLRAPGASAKRISFGYAGKPFALASHTIEVPVPRELQRDAQATAGVDLSARAVMLGMNSMGLRLEYEQAKIATTAANYGTANKIDLAGVGNNKWSVTAGDPAKDIETGKDAVRAKVGVYPNTLLLSAKAFKALRANEKIIERFKYTSAASITTEMLANLLDLERVVVGKAVAIDDGVQVDIWGNNAILAYVPLQALSMEQPSFGYTYTMQGHPMVEQPYFDTSAKSQIYGVSFERAAVLTGADCGYLIQNPS